MVIGDQDLPAAVFVFKTDKTVAAAWDAVSKIADQEGALRGELHDSKVPFLEGLNSWNQSVDPTNSFLCIYSHAGKSGIAPSDSPTRDEIVRWEELADALPQGVRHLWLLGCDTNRALDVWDDFPVPVAHRCLFTTESKLWLPFIKFFAHEISVQNIHSSDELVDRLKADAPELASLTTYSTNPNWKPR